MKKKDISEIYKFLSEEHANFAGGLLFALAKLRLKLAPLAEEVAKRTDPKQAWTETVAKYIEGRDGIIVANAEKNDAGEPIREGNGIKIVDMPKLIEDLKAYDEANKDAKEALEHQAKALNEWLEEEVDFVPVVGKASWIPATGPASDYTALAALISIPEDEE